MTHEERLQETYRRFPHLRPDKNHLWDAELQQDIKEITGLQECPHCGNKFLRMESGCASCLSCGWSACGR